MTNIITTTLQNGGGTFRDGSDISDTLTTGYVVGGVVPSAVVRPEDANPLLAYFAANYTTIGTWLHDGMIHIDVVQHFEDKALAILTGKERHEIAIWDCANHCEITL